MPVFTRRSQIAVRKWKPIQAITQGPTMQAPQPVAGKPTQHASWTNPAGSDESSDCTWACETGYTKNSPQNTACIIHETLTGIALTSQDLQGISNSKKAIKPSVTNLRFTITSSDVLWWYVTHTPPTTFNPRGKKTSDSRGHRDRLFLGKYKTRKLPCFKIQYRRGT